MKRRAVILSALLVAAAAEIAAWLFVFRSAPQMSGPLRHEVYVWQRAWTEPVRSAVTQHATNFSSVVVLRAEVSWKDKKPQVTRVAVDYRTLSTALAGNNSANGRADLPVGQDAPQRVPTIGFALRIGPYAGPFATNDPSAIFLTDLAVSLVEEARTNHLNLSELQIDFDCAESKLDGYGVWVEAIQKRVAPLPVTITALPSWLNASAFKRLAAVATNYVLQVHSLERPTDIHAPFTLCDPRAAKRAVRRAGRIGVPFRVALPTYGYIIAFDKTGKFIGLSAEGPHRNWPEGTQLREVSADPLAMAALVKTWTASRPAAMCGVIWYRLPVATDNYNWRWPTLAAIIAGRLPRDGLRSE